MPDIEERQEGDRAPLLKDKPQIRFDVRKCPIESVVVYTDRAEVKREVCAQLQAGETELIVEGLSVSINGESIRVEGVGAATILDVIYQTSEKQEEKAVEDDLERKEDTYKATVTAMNEKKKELKILGFTQETLVKQKSLLEQFAKQVCMIKSQKPEEMHIVAATAVASVMEFMEGYQERVANIDNRLLGLETTASKLKEEIKVLEDRAEKVNPEGPKEYVTEDVRSVKVTLGAEEDVNIRLLISYVVYNASWSPSYDLRVFTKDKSMKVHYYGLIKQSTGEDWENAKISLSTAQPSVGGSAPKLGIQNIQFKQPIYRYFAKTKKKGVMLGASIGLSRRSTASYYDEELEDDSEDDSWSVGDNSFTVEKLCALPGSARGGAPPPPPPPQMKVDVAKVATGQLYNTTYSIPRSSTIPADSTEHRVTVAVIDLQPKFGYVSVPRLSPYSFLQATVKNTSAYTILTGPANVFLDNNFLTKSEMTSTSPNEEFTSSLGADQAIRITCEPVSTVRGTHGRLTKNNQVNQTHVFQVKNTQANPVELKVMEQVPLTQDEKLKVALQEPLFNKPGARVAFSYGYALLNSSNNVEWHCTIPQDTTITLRLAYTVEYPIDCTVKGLPST